jgi:hypothetical protein
MTDCRLVRGAHPTGDAPWELSALEEFFLKILYKSSTYSIQEYFLQTIFWFKRVKQSSSTPTATGNEWRQENKNRAGAHTGPCRQ